MRAFNAREGLTRDNDTLPKKAPCQPLKVGKSDGMIISQDEFEHGLDMYYEQAGWSPTQEHRPVATLGRGQPRLGSPTT